MWDLDGKKYYDFAGMGVTSCTLGYANKDVNNEIKKALVKGGMCTLNADDEFYLAKKLLKIHTWAEMAKFCKSGGEACMVAIRLARAATKKQKIVFVDIMVGMIGIWLQIYTIVKILINNF